MNSAFTRGAHVQDIMISPESVLSFWFEEITPQQWWKQSPEFDQLVKQRFGPVHAAARVCELFDWRQTPRGRLAEIIVLDQFSRNIYRDQAAAFACDPLALALAQTAVAAHIDQSLDPSLRPFLYMPYMHSESRVVHAQALALFEVPGLESFLRSELQHKAIIDRFGRYPHRNALIGRSSTVEELEFMKKPGSSF
jgi:uncharacterized protein (DUF924 family)